MGTSSLAFMEKLNTMKKTDYIEQLQNLVASHATKLTVKQIRQLIAKYQ